MVAPFGCADLASIIIKSPTLLFDMDFPLLTVTLLLVTYFTRKDGVGFFSQLLFVRLLGNIVILISCCSVNAFFACSWVTKSTAKCSAKSENPISSILISFSLNVRSKNDAFLCFTNRNLPSFFSSQLISFDTLLML